MGGKRRNAGTKSEPRLTSEMLEKFREVGIRLDRAGVFWHQGSAISHPRLAQALRRWLDVRESDGKPILRLDERRYAYVDVDDAMLLIESIQWRDGVPIASLNDGTEEPLAVDSLMVGPGFALYARARGGKLLARLIPRAYYALSESIDETEHGFALVVRGQSFPIGDLNGTRKA